MALFYNNNGTVSEIIINGMIDGKVTSSLAAAPTISSSLQTSASNAIIERAILAGSSSAQAYGLGFPNSTRTNSGTTYLSSATVQKTYSGNSYSVLFPNDPNDATKKGYQNYWITGSAIIPPTSITFVSSSLGLGPANTTAKLSINVSNLNNLFGKPLKDANDVQSLRIFAYNGIKSVLSEFNQISSSIDNGVYQSYAVFYISASKDNMGSVAGNNLHISLGTTQLRS